MEATILVFLLFILILSIFLGVEIISKVPSLLHTPLMSGSNAISGVTVVGAIVAAGLAKGTDNNDMAALLGGIAIMLAMINVVGGYFVTDRMLNMFRKKEKKTK
jgi:H+-translocating NAD(P) transhydrogenase subunit alpha